MSSLVDRLTDLHTTQLPNLLADAAALQAFLGGPSVPVIVPPSPPVVTPVVPITVAGSSPSASQLAAGFDTVDFFDDFTDIRTIDPVVRSSRDASMPTTSPDGYPIQWRLGWLNTIADFEIVEGTLLRIKRDGSGYGQALQTLVKPGIGYLSSGSMSFEVRCRAVNPPWTAVGFPNSSFVAWSQSQKFIIEDMSEAAGNPVKEMYAAELDFVETPASQEAYFGGGKGGVPAQFTILMDANFFHRYVDPRGAAFGYQQQGSYLPWSQAIMNSSIISLINPDFDIRELHNYRTDLTLPEGNNGVGLIKRYIDDVHLPAGDVTWVAGDGQPMNLFSNDLRYLLLGTGPSCMSDYDWVKVVRRG